MLTDYDIDNIDELISDSKRYDWFSARLLQLMAKCDMDNLAKLASVYPYEFYEFARWKWHGMPQYFIGVSAVYDLVTYKRAHTENALEWIYPTGQQIMEGISNV